MAKITVVGNAPFPVVLEDGVSVPPGEILTTERTSLVEQEIEQGKLREAAPMKGTDGSSEPTGPPKRKQASTPTPEDTDSPKETT